MNDTTSRISNVLPQVRLLKDKYDELAAVTGEDYNVFSILGLETDEVRTHSAFLADLLNPQGSHRQGAAFQKLFLKAALNHSELEKDSETFQVKKEAFTDHGRIDILLEKNDACIVIENKIYADDQDAQMERYYDYATSKRLSEEQIKLVYLTLDGSPPSKGSLGKLPEERVKCLSYSEDIINWLEECMKLQEVQRISSIREILFQYRDLLKQLTGQSTNNKYSMELTEMLIKDKNYELIPHLEKMILEFKVNLQFKFWEELKKQILDLPEVVDWHKTQDDAHVPSEDNIRNYYLWKTERYLWQTFDLGTVRKQYELALNTAIKYRPYAKSDIIYFGFTLYKNDEIFDWRKWFKKPADQPGDGFKYDDHHWLIWKYSEGGIGFPVEYPNPVVDALLDDKKREEVVKELVSEIADAVRNLKEQLK